jgi:NAD(P)-dependent dehydrogenase (short-subunit alcohol dehydrogenase family)
MLAHGSTERVPLRETAAMNQALGQQSTGRLDGKVALITGASKGIGEAVAATYAAAGAAVMLSSRKQDALDEAAAAIVAATEGARVATFAANAGDPDQAEACVAATVEQFGGLDILVNNAATNPHFGSLIDIELGAWDKIFQVNLRGAFVWTQLAWRAWMEDHGGVVVNMSSVGGFRHGGGLGAYNVTKAGLIHLTKILAAELAPGVRVNALAPGIVQTDFSRVLWEGLDESRAVPLGRFGTPHDVAQAALFLASDASSWITGETLLIDGGALVGARFV